MLHPALPCPAQRQPLLLSQFRKSAAIVTNAPAVVIVVSLVTGRHNIRHARLSITKISALITTHGQSIQIPLTRKSDRSKILGILRVEFRPDKTSLLLEG